MPRHFLPSRAGTPPVDRPCLSRPNREAGSAPRGLHRGATLALCYGTATGWSWRGRGWSNGRGRGWGRGCWCPHCPPLLPFLLPLLLLLLLLPFIFCYWQWTWEGGHRAFPKDVCFSVHHGWSQGYPKNYSSLILTYCTYAVLELAFENCLDSLQ